MLHLLCIGRVASTIVAGGAALSYNQLDGADPASRVFDFSAILAVAGRVAHLEAVRHLLEISAMSPSDVRELRILVEHRQKLYRLCKLAFAKSDSSIYIFPYAREGKFFYGSRSMPERQFKDTFPFKEQLTSDEVPKISIHESGQVHVISSGVRAGPLQIPPLSSLRGQHIASVVADQFSVLAEFTGKPRPTGSRIDHVIPAEDTTESGRLAFYLAGDRPAFEAPNCRLVFTLRRITLREPIYLGIKPIAQDPMGAPKGIGVTAIAGWDLTGEYQEGADYLFVRGQ